MRTHEARVCSFVPPFILESIVQNGTREEQQAAAATLLVDSSVRIAREVADAADSRTAEEDTATPPKNRRVSSANNGTDLPGALKRGEGDPATGDAAVDEAYDGLGGTFDLLWEAFGRNSIDDKGMDLNATVHYGKKYNNAFWDGTQMVFGDGDEVIFNRFTIAPRRRRSRTGPRGHRCHSRAGIPEPIWRTQRIDLRLHRGNGQTTDAGANIRAGRLAHRSWFTDQRDQW